MMLNLLIFSLCQVLELENYKKYKLYKPHRMGGRQAKNPTLNNNAIRAVCRARNIVSVISAAEYEFRLIWLVSRLLCLYGHDCSAAYTGVA